MHTNAPPAEAGPPVKTARTGKDRKKGFIWEIRSHYLLYIFTLPALLYLLIFRYIPIVGTVIAFQKFNPVQGLFNSEFVGLDNFRFFFRGSQWRYITFNTFFLNVLFIASGTVVSIIIAIMMTELAKNLYVRISQSVMILPNFISWVVVALFSIAFIGGNGLVNKMILSSGGSPILFYTDAGIWPGLFVIIRIWKGAGIGSVFYMAAITGFDTEMYEAAIIDGASRLQRIWRITLPMLPTTIVIMTLLSVGGLFYGDFAMIYAFIGDNAVLYPTTDVIDTYVFRALRSTTNMGMTAAIGLYQSFIGFILVLITNMVVKKVNPESAIF
jgi:putative aldouronate transport system permease protein